MADNLHLTDSDVYRAIKHHELPTNISIEDIKSVFLAYADIVEHCLKNDVEVPLPKIGTFSKVRKKGWKGRRLRVREDVFDQSNTNYIYKDIPTKPDFWDTKFDWKKVFHDRIKKEINL